jgi:hypothetical protein
MYARIFDQFARRETFQADVVAQMIRARVAA